MSESGPREDFATADAAARQLAGEFARLICANDAAGRPNVLGRASSSTPGRLHRQLIWLHREEGLSFARVITFNLGEYDGLPRMHPESYWRFKHEQFFNHINIPLAKTHVPNGTVSRGEAFEWCRNYEEKIRVVGGLDLQILGIGRTGHIGFNEPGSTSDSRTRLVMLDQLTRREPARDFLGEAHVPRHAIRMGVGTILDARLTKCMRCAGKCCVPHQVAPTSAVWAHFIDNYEHLPIEDAGQSPDRVCRPRHRVPALDPN